MKKLILTLSIVLLLAACDDEDIDNNGETDNTDNTEKVEKLDPLPVTNIRHTKESNSITIYWENPPDGYREIGLDVAIYDTDEETLIDDNFNFIGNVCYISDNIENTRIKDQLTITNSRLIPSAFTQSQPRKILFTFRVRYGLKYKSPNEAITYYFIDVP